MRISFIVRLILTVLPGDTGGICALKVLCAGTTTVGTDEVLLLVVAFVVDVVGRDCPTMIEPMSRISITAPVNAIRPHILVLFGFGFGAGIEIILILLHLIGVHAAGL